MNKITLYLWKSILIAILLVLTLFIGLEFIFSLVNELRYVGTGSYTTLDAFNFIFLSMPQHIAQLFPMATLVGTLMGLGLLASRSELIILRSSGMSLGDIIAAVLKLSFILALVVWFMGEWVSPIAEKMAHDNKALSLSQGQALRTKNGTWMRDANNFIHIQSMTSDGHLEGITLHEIQETVFEQDKTSRQKIDEQIWNSNLSPEVLSQVGMKDLDDLSLMGLWHTISYREKNHLETKPYQLALWQKIVRPLATLVMMFLAIPFVFGPLRSATMGLRMLVGVLVGFTFYTFNQLFGPLTLVYQIPPIVGAFLPTVLFLLLGLFFLKRTN